MLIGPIRSQILLTGIELEVFNFLSEAKSSVEVANAMGTHPKNTGVLLDGLAAMDLITKKNGHYRNTQLSEVYLVKRRPAYMGGMFSFWSQSLCMGLDDLSRYVKEGPPPENPPEMDIDSDEMWSQNAIFMSEYQRAGLAQLAVEIVSQLPEFHSFEKMLDLGGCAGIVGISIVAAHPRMKGVIFDKPPVVKISKDFIELYEMKDRVTTIGGDYNNDSIGEGYDLIWASASLNFAGLEIDALMKKIYNALNDKGVFVSLSEGLTHERTKPELIMLGFLSAMMMGKGLFFSQGFIGDCMLRAGFRSVRGRTIDTPSGPMELEIGRK